MDGLVGDGLGGSADFTEAGEDLGDVVVLHFEREDVARAVRPLGVPDVKLALRPAELVLDLLQFVTTSSGDYPSFFYRGKNVPKVQRHSVNLGNENLP